MTDRPILFSTPMIRALLDGRKTQTRRIINPQPTASGSVYVGDQQITMAEWQARHEGRLKINVGDRLWVREAWNSVIGYENLPPRDIPANTPVHYKADGEPEYGWVWGRYRHSQFMPRWASRITLTVTDVRVERLQDISRGDAMAEGCPFPNMAKGDNPSDWYAALWDTINGPGAWEANPWVVAYTFTVEHRNIDGAIHE